MNPEVRLYTDAEVEAANTLIAAMENFPDHGYGWGSSFEGHGDALGSMLDELICLVPDNVLPERIRVYRDARRRERAYKLRDAHKQALEELGQAEAAIEKYSKKIKHLKGEPKE